MATLSREAIKSIFDSLNEEIKKHAGLIKIEYTKGTRDIPLLIIPQVYTIIPTRPSHPFRSAKRIFQKVNNLYFASAILSTYEKGTFFECSQDYAKALEKYGLRFKEDNHQAVGSIFGEEKKYPMFLLPAVENDCARLIAPNREYLMNNPVTNLETFTTLVERLEHCTNTLIDIVQEKRKDTPEKRTDGIFVFYPETSTLVDSRGKQYHN